MSTYEMYDYAGGHGFPEVTQSPAGRSGLARYFVNVGSLTAYLCILELPYFPGLSSRGSPSSVLP
jgi:hypothetical protein